MTSPLPARAARALPVLETEPARRGPDRSTDRRITFAGLGAAVMFLVLAAGSLALPADTRLGQWLPAHFALAGAAGTAISAMLPFFVAALAVGTPAPPRLRVAAVLLVAGGAVLGIAGRAAAGGATSPIAASGALAYVVGMALVGAAAARSLRSATGTRRPVTEAAYAIGLADVLAGASIVAVYLAGNPAAAAGWSGLRVAHAWLNVLGFVTLVIAGTLVHFAPTVAGSRIRSRRSGTVAVAALSIAAPLVAAGYVTGSGMLAGIGAAAAVAGAGALSVHGVRAHRDRAGWTGDLAWHRFTGGSLLIAPCWLLIAVIVAGDGIVAHGADPLGWRFDQVIGPLLLGFVVQVVLGSLSHLLPAIGPGTPQAHAVQRRVLGTAATRRLAGWNLGVGVLSVGQLAGASLPAMAGTVVLLVSGVATLALLGRALRR